MLLLGRQTLLKAAVRKWLYGSSLAHVHIMDIQVWAWSRIVPTRSIAADRT